VRLEFKDAQLASQMRPKTPTLSTSTAMH